MDFEETFAKTPDDIKIAFLKELLDGNPGIGNQFLDYYEADLVVLQIFLDRQSSQEYEQNQLYTPTTHFVNKLVKSLF